MIIEPVDFGELIRARAERRRDAVIREQLGLRYVGLFWPDFGAEPREMFVNVNGRRYLKLALCRYEIHPADRSAPSPIAAAI